MAFGHSTRSRRRSTSPEPPPKPPRPRQRAESTPVPPTQYGYRYATTSTYSVNTCHASPPVTPYHQIGTMSMVRLPPQPALPPPQSFPGMLVASPQPEWNPQQPLPPRRPSKWKSYTCLNQSMSHLVSHTVEKTNATIQELEQLVHQSLGGGANVNEATSRLLDQVITSIDLGSFCGRESELSKPQILIYLLSWNLLLTGYCSRRMCCPFSVRQKRSPFTANGKETHRLCGLFLQSVLVRKLTATTAYTNVEVVRKPP